MSQIVTPPSHYPGEAAAGGLTHWAFPPSPESEPLRRDVWQIVRRNVWLIAACTLLAAGAAAVVTARKVPIYEASASIRVDERQSGVPALDILQAYMSTSEISTEREMLASRTIAEQVVDSLGLQFALRRPHGTSRDSLFSAIEVPRHVRYGLYRLLRGPAGNFAIRSDSGIDAGVAVVGRIATLDSGRVRFRLEPAAAEHELIEIEVIGFDDAVDGLRGALGVDRVSREVNIIGVTYRGTDPVLVRDIPNAIAATFISRRQEAKQAASRSTVTFLNGQIEKLTDQLQSAETALRRFRESHRIVSLPDQARAQISRVADLQAQRSTIETERSALARLVAAARGTDTGAESAERVSYRDMLAFPTLLRNQAASQLLATLTAVEERRSELMTRRSPQDPDVRLLDQRTGQLEDQLRKIADVYLRGLTDQVASLDAELAQSERQLVSIPVQETQLARLQREAKGLEDIYTMLQGRLKEAEIAAAVEDGSVRIMDSAVMPRWPVEPNLPRSVAVAVAVGLMLGVSASFAREIADRSIHSRRDVQLITGGPVLGLLPHIRPTGKWASRLGWRSRGLLARIAPRTVPRNVGARATAVVTGRASDAWSAAREAFNGLQANLTFALAPDAPRAVVVTSSLAGDGKTTVAINLAGTLARQGQKVLLVDADLRRGIVHSVFRVPRAPGLSDVLSGASDAGGALRPTPLGGGRMLHVLTRGTAHSDPAQLLGPARMHAFVDRMTSEFDWIIIDSPPLNIVADAALLSATGAGVILVARAGVTERDALAYAMDQLRSVRATVVGTVLNGIGKREASYDPAYQYHEYASGYHSDGPGGARGMVAGAMSDQRA